MRIISRFRDYYDGVMKTGMDREVVYVRETKDIVLEEPIKCGFDTKRGSTYAVYGGSASYTIGTMFLGYCGKIYKVYTVKGDEYDFISYDYEEFKAFLIEHNMGSRYDFSESRWFPSRYHAFRDYDTSKMIEFFHKFQTPLFLVNHTYSYRKPDKTTVTLGPCLKDLGFQRLKDSYTTYQDIFQFVAGTLNKPENKMVKISDKDKIHKHGFDKWSFRKLPTKRKKK